MDSKKWAIVDSDFLRHLLEAKIEGKTIISAITSLFLGLELTPAMNGLVYKNEMLACKPATVLFSENVVSVIELSKILGDSVAVNRYTDIDVAKAYYRTVFLELYNSLGYDAIPVSDLFSDWKSSACLGEVHSVTTCFFIDCDIFLSDDKDSKTLKDAVASSSTFSFQIKLFNRTDACKLLAEQSPGALSRKERHALSHLRCN